MTREKYPMSNYAGIDYSGPAGTREATNRDAKTGIRYGVIHAAEVDYWFEESEGVYIEPSCKLCGTELDKWEDEDGAEVYYCACCETTYDDAECDEIEASEYVVDTEDLVAMQSGDDCDVFVMKSKYMTFATHCSPCAPGACSLNAPLERRLWTALNACYCFGHDWFDGGEAPYPVYSVEEYLKGGLSTLKEVLPQ